MRFSEFPFLRYLPFFILGVLSDSLIELPWLLGPLLLGILWGGYWLLLFLKSQGSTFLISSLAYLSLVVLGFVISSFQQEVNKTQQGLQESKGYFAKALRHDTPKPNSRENLLDVIAYRDSLQWKRASHKIILYHQAELQPGQLLFVSQSPELLDPPTFPGEFDYRAFLARKGIHYRQFVRIGPTILGIEADNSPEFWILNLRKSLSLVLEKFMKNPESRQIASALLLGEKEALDREVRKSYSETGTMHILAVSGLHVGIIYAILLFPLKRVKAKSRIRKGYLLLVIGLIWIYALLTGFSPSVIRASFMFTLFSLGQMRERKPSIWNILAFSALVMIAINPEVIHEVGFQLSYAAVAGIVGLQPIIVRWWEPQSRILEYFWQLAAVSMAAQLATFPLTLYYFHIFPTYFLLANLVIIPMAFVAMIMGLGLLGLAWIPGIGVGLGYVLDHWILAQNSVNSFFQNLPGGVQDRLTISLLGMVCVWGMLLIWGNWELGNRKRLMYFAVILLALWRLEALIREISKPMDEILIFSKEGKSLIQSQVGSHFLVWNQDFPPEQISFSLEPLRIQQGMPLMPEKLRGIPTETGVYFPGLGFAYSFQQNEILLDSDSQFQVRKLGN